MDFLFLFFNFECDCEQGGMMQGQNIGASGTAANQAPASGTAAQPKQRVRARRGQATDPHSIAERVLS